LNEHVLELKTESWEGDVLKAEQPVLVDFWAEWCAPCRMIAPSVEAVAVEFAGRVKVGKLNVDQHPEVAERYGVRSIPTLLVFRAGQVVEQRVGALPKAALAALVESHAAKQDVPARG
jgi:thioredoxin 1